MTGDNLAYRLVRHRGWTATAVRQQFELAPESAKQEYCYGRHGILGQVQRVENFMIDRDRACPPSGPLASHLFPVPLTGVRSAETAETGGSGWCYGRRRHATPAIPEWHR